MPKITVRNKSTGRAFSMQQRHARVLLERGRGKWEDVSAPPPPPPPSDGLDELSYNELRAKVRARALEPDSFRRDDLMAALRYQHRSMTAAD